MIVSVDIEFWLTVLLCQYLTIFSISCSMVFSEKSTVIQTCISFPIINVSFLYDNFQYFLFVFSFQKFNYHLGTHFIGLILFRVCSASSICRIVSFTKFGKCSAIIPPFYFSGLSAPPFFSLIIQSLDLLPSLCFGGRGFPQFMLPLFKLGRFF